MTKHEELLIIYFFAIIVFLIFLVLGLYMYIVHSRNVKKEAPKLKILRFIFGLSFILPASSRRDFRDDIEDIVKALKEENYKKWQIIGVVILNIISVLYHALLFKLSSYFYSEKKVEK